MALGQIFKEARISRGYTESEVAERIKMNAQMIVDLEAENYSRIAAPIYGKGYVRKYAEFLGIDYRPLVEEFKNTFGTGNVEKPAVPLESFDPESGMLTKVVPAQTSKPTVDVKQPTVAVVQPVATPAQVVGQTASAPIEQSPSLFSDFDSPAINADDTSQINQEEKKEEVFVPAHLAKTPPTPTIPPANAIPDSVAQSRYTFSPEKFTPRTTVFKPEQLPSASAPEPIALSVSPFAYPEPEGIVDNGLIESDEQTIVVSDEEEENTLFSTKKNRHQGPILSKYSGQKKSIKPEPIFEKTNEEVNPQTPNKFVEFIVNLGNKITAYFKDIFNTKPEEDLTKALARKQRRLGFIFTSVIVVIIISIFAFSGSDKNPQADELNPIIEQQIVDADSSQDIPNLLDNEKPELTQVEIVEVRLIHPTPKGFIN